MDKFVPGVLKSGKTVVEAARQTVDDYPMLWRKMGGVVAMMGHIFKPDGSVLIVDRECVVEWLKDHGFGSDEEVVGERYSEVVDRLIRGAILVSPSEAVMCSFECVDDPDNPTGMLSLCVTYEDAQEAYVTTWPIWDQGPWRTLGPRERLSPQERADRTRDRTIYQGLLLASQQMDRGEGE